MFLAKESELTVFTIGHSTRTLEEFIGLFKTCGVALLVDVRTEFLVADITPNSTRKPCQPASKQKA